MKILLIDLGEYIDTFSRAINENIQIQISQIAATYNQKLKNFRDKDLSKLEVFLRSSGISYYASIELRLKIF